MLLLGVETSGRHGSIALARGTRESFAVIEVVPLAGGAYSARLIPELASLLARHDLHKRDLDAFVVVAGPGSFTGLRVGLSAVKGLAEILRRPIATVSMLEAIAVHANHDGPVIAALDAGREEVYAGEYELHSGRPSMRRELLFNRRQFSALLEANVTAELVTPDMAVGELCATHLRVKQIDWPDAGEIACLGLHKLCAGQTVTPDVLEANYIRRSDAEIFASHGVAAEKNR